MAEHGNRGPNEPSFRRGQSGRKRREPPVIDGTATDLSAADLPDAGTGPSAPAEPSPAEPSPAEPSPAEPKMEPAAEPGPATEAGLGAEPVLFGSAVRDEAARAEEVAPALSNAEQGGGATPPTKPLAGSAPPLAEELAPGSGTASTEPAGPGQPSEPSRARRWSALSVALGVLVLALLAAIAGLLYTEPQRSHSAALSASITALQGKVAALESRPDATRAEREAASAGQRTAALDSGLASLRKDLGELASRVAAISAKADANASRLASLDQAGAAAPSPAAPPPAAAPSPETAVLANKVDDLARRLDSVENAAKQTASAPPAVDLGPLEARIGDLDHRLGDLDRRLADLDRRVETLGGTVASIPKVDLAPLQAAVAGIERRLVPLEAAVSAPKAPDRVTEARAVGSVEEARAAPLAVVAQALTQALAEGRPFVPEVDALRGLGVDDATLAPLLPAAAKGVPTLDTLRTRWADRERQVLADARPNGSDTVLDRFAAGARSLVQVRRIDAATGEAPSSLVGQIGAALDRGDLGQALADWAKLPEPGRQASQGWADAVRTRLDAETTAQALQSRAIGALAKAKG